MSINRLRFTAEEASKNNPKHEKLKKFEKDGFFELGRGKVIGQDIISKNPGDYNVYSSSTRNKGKIGSVNFYNFSEDLITWSIDGGGNFFLRENEKFSITNVSGYLRIKNDLLKYRYVFYYLTYLHSKLKFDYSLKAHPSVIRNVYRVYFPNQKEQEKIGNFLSLFDRLIEKVETKVGLLKELKKGYLQQMFPAKGDKAPKIRFVGFDGDWEQLELNEISSSYSGGTPNVSVSEYYGSDIPFIRSGEIYSSTTELCISFRGIENSSAKLVDKGDILYAMYGANSGEVAISKIHGAINQAILAIKVKKNYNSYLLFQYLKREKNRIISKYLQGGQGNLSGHIIKKIKILMPKQIDEQNNIGNFLQYLDSMIEKHEKELHSIEQLKKGYMQRLFA